jgi:hypothetical protein
LLLLHDFWDEKGEKVSRLILLFGSKIVDAGAEGPRQRKEKTTKNLLTFFGRSLPALN